MQHLTLRALHSGAAGRDGHYQRDPDREAERYDERLLEARRSSRRM
jgi:hypothetical protein